MYRFIERGQSLGVQRITGRGDELTAGPSVQCLYRQGHPHAGLQCHRNNEVTQLCPITGCFITRKGLLDLEESAGKPQEETHRLLSFM